MKTTRKPLGVPPLSSAAFAAALALFTAHAAASGIYTCVDASGRRLTSDRPILECIDREQRELNPSGTVRRVIAPSYTAQERAALEAKARKDAEEQRRLADERLRLRALATRFPDQASFERERAAAMATLEEVMASASRRTSELRIERRRLDGEVEFYAKDPARAPASLRRAIEDNERALQAQERFIADQTKERQRVADYFDDIQAQLLTLWAQQPPKAAATAK